MSAPKEATMPSANETPQPTDDKKPTSLRTYLKTARASLKSYIKGGVDSANAALAGLEASTENMGHPVIASLKTLKSEGDIAASHLSNVYKHRKEYGPHIVAGSSLLLGGMVGLRRGRIPGIVTASATGLLAYVGVYELDFDKIPQIIFGDSQN